jgi:diguanylate cyclase (GGDEF)-like protein/PAS domain S-box-containing protein
MISLTLTRKVALGLTSLLLVGMLAAAVVYRGLYVAQDSVTQITQVAAPSAVAAYEMEINVVEYGLKVLKYLERGEASYRTGARDDSQDFERFHRRYSEVAQTPRDRELAEKAGVLFAEFRTLGLQLMDGADARRAEFERFGLIFQELDQWIDHKLAAAMDPAGARVYEKLHAVRGLEANAAEVGAGLGYYAWAATDAHRALIVNNATEFERDLALLRALPLDAQERALTDKTAVRWQAARAQIEKAMVLKDKTGHDLSHFLELRVLLDNLLDEGVQVHAYEGLTAAQQEATSAQTHVVYRLILVAAIYIGLAVFTLFAVVRAVHRPITELIAAAEAFGRGNLEHRLKNLGDAELDKVAESFNRMARDLEKSMVSREMLRESEEKYRSILMDMDEGYYETDLEGNLTFFNPGFARLLGFPASELIGANNRQFTSADSAKEILEVFNNVYRGGVPARDIEIEIQRPAGDRLTVCFSVRLMRDTKGAPSGFRGVVYDMSARKRSEEALARKAMFDALTGLPNRYLLGDRLKQALQAATRAGGPCALLVLDVDNFKGVNDSLGHGAGDVLLKELGARLRRSMRDTDTLARLGGDEFAIVLPGADQIQADRVAHAIARELDRPVDLEATATIVRLSIGSAIYPSHGQDPDELMRHADMAMYAVKRNRSGYMSSQESSAAA